MFTIDRETAPDSFHRDLFIFLWNHGNRLDERRGFFKCGVMSVEAIAVATNKSILSVRSGLTYLETEELCSTSLEWVDGENHNQASFDYQVYMDRADCRNVFVDAFFRDISSAKKDNPAPAIKPAPKKKIHKTRPRKNVRKPKDVQLLYKQQKGKCWWCGHDLLGVYHVDHRRPHIKDGPDELGNLCLACPKCNLRKHDKMPHEFNGRLL